VLGCLLASRTMKLSACSSTVQGGEASRGAGSLRGQGVAARAIVVLRDGWLQFRQIGALVPVSVAASKKNQSVRGLVLGRKPHGLLDTDKVAGVLAPAVWACPMEIARHHTL
jgi:hypothetical protein